MAAIIVIGVSALLRLATLLYALHLVRTTGRWKAWALVAVAMVFTVVRECMALYRALFGKLPYPPDLTSQLLTLVASIFIFAGVLWIASLIRTVQRSGDELHQEIAVRRKVEEVLREAREQLELRVRERTAELTRLNEALQQEIAARKKAEETLRESEERFRSAFESAPIGIALVSPEGRFLKVNRSLCETTGYSEQELLARDVQSITHPDDLDADLGYVQRMLNKEIRAYQVEKRYFHKLGHVVWVMLSRSVVHDVHDNPIYFIAQSEDITERKKAEETLRESEERFRSAFESAPIGIALISHEGRFLRVNRSLCEITGYSEEELCARDFQSITHPDDLEANLAYMRRMLNKEIRTYQMEKRYLHKRGHVVWVMLNRSMVCDVHDNPIYFIAQIEDITERKAAEERIGRLNRELEQRVAELTVLNKELEAFSYSVSHDLRAPLRSIDGFSQALLEDHADTLNAEGKSDLQRVRAASQNMARLIDDMLILARVTRSEMRRETVDLTALARTIAAELQKAEPGREVEFVIAEGATATGDRRLLTTVLENLLDNAWKFTGKHARARIDFGVAENEGRQAFFVRDDGAGFDMTYAGKLFGAFQRLHPSDQFKGTGIGLATVQRIIHRHGGKVWAEGAVEKGATFYFTLGR